MTSFWDRSQLHIPGYSHIGYPDIVLVTGYNYNLRVWGLCGANHLTVPCGMRWLSVDMNCKRIEEKQSDTGVHFAWHTL